MFREQAVHLVCTLSRQCVTGTAELHEPGSPDTGDVHTTVGPLPATS